MIFLDMDGVFADFDSHYERHFGYRPTRWPHEDTTDWARVGAVPDFYETIPLMPGALKLFDYVVNLCTRFDTPGPTFLTGVPKSVDASENQKTRWAARHFPGTPIICCPAKAKWVHGRPGDILIDDYLRYRVDWENMGGIFIHHTDVPRTVAELGKCVSALGSLQRP